MENRDISVVPTFIPLNIRGDLGEKTLKKTWKSYMQGWFWKRKNQINIRGFLNTFSKNTFFSPIYKGDYWPTFDFKVCFFFTFSNLISRAKCFFGTIASKIHTCWKGNFFRIVAEISYFQWVVPYGFSSSFV